MRKTDSEERRRHERQQQRWSVRVLSVTLRVMCDISRAQNDLMRSAYCRNFDSEIPPTGVSITRARFSCTRLCCSSMLRQSAASQPFQSFSARKQSPLSVFSSFLSFLHFRLSSGPVHKRLVSVQAVPCWWSVAAACGPRRQWPRPSRRRTWCKATAVWRRRRRR